MTPNLVNAVFNTPCSTWSLHILKPVFDELRWPTKYAPLPFHLASRHPAISHLLFKYCFQTGASPRPLKRGGLEDSSSNYKNLPLHQMFMAEVREASAEVLTQALCQPSEFFTIRPIVPPCQSSRRRSPAACPCTPSGPRASSRRRGRRRSRRPHCPRSPCRCRAGLRRPRSPRA